MLATASSSMPVKTALDVSPDDSDLVDISLTQVQDTKVPGISATADALSPIPSSTPAVRDSALKKLPKLVHGLIPVSNRFWFAVFPKLVDADQLNVGDGLAMAHIPEDIPTSARPRKLEWFCIDEDLIYLSFSNDWGPLNVAMFYRFCVHVHQVLMSPGMEDTHLVLYTSMHPHHKANAALLCALYAMTIDHISPADAFHPYSEMEFKPFRDAGYGRADYSLTIQDILYGVRRALDHELLDLTTFDLESYEFYEQVQNGDWNWITPHFLAFASPKDRAYMATLASQGPYAAECTAKRMPVNPSLQRTVEYFQQHNITLVVRLNNALYHRGVFEDAGIEHKDLYFDDGSNPSDDILRTFIQDADRTIKAGGVIAVHCKAGLGRTGVLIGAYLIWRYGFTASEVIGYMRLMRPGCVVGPQQHFMYENASKWVRWGVEDRLRAELARQISTAAVPSDIPQTPATSRIVDVPATAPVHHIHKPTPCVGQPRKSPSPKRRRLGIVEESVSTRAQVTADDADAKLVAAELGVAPCTDAEVLGVIDANEASSPATRASKLVSTTRTSNPAPTASTTNANPLPTPKPPSPIVTTTDSDAMRATKPASPVGLRERRTMAPAQQPKAGVRTVRSPAAKPVVIRMQTRPARPGAENRPPTAIRTRPAATATAATRQPRTQ